MSDAVYITLFSACYALALAVEMARLLRRRGMRNLPTLLMAAVGLIVQTFYLWQRATSDAPLSSWYDWYLVAAWVLAVAYQYLALRHPQGAIGAFMLPLVLLLTFAAVFADREPFPARDAAALWAATHGVLLLLGTVAVSIGFASGAMYLVQAYRLKHKMQPGDGFKLPSLEWLQQVNARAIVVSVVTLGAGILAGVILNLVERPADGTWHVAWNDPTVISSLLTATWLTAAVVFEAVYKPARVGRKVAYLTVVNFLFLVLMLVVTLLYDSGHGASSVHRARGRRRQLGSAAGRQSMQDRMAAESADSSGTIEPGQPMAGAAPVGRYGRKGYAVLQGRTKALATPATRG